jgi:DNA-binding transcriptional MerR regulator
MNRIGRLDHKLEISMGSPRLYRIGELASSVGLTTRTIRYYEEIGLLDSVRRVEGGKRLYSDQDNQRLRFIKRLKDLGLTLAEMQELEDIYRIDRTNRRVLPRLLQLLESHATRIDNRVRNLNKLRNEIISYQERIKQKLNNLDDVKNDHKNDKK